MSRPKVVSVKLCSNKHDKLADESHSSRHLEKSIFVAREWAEIVRSDKCA